MKLKNIKELNELKKTSQNKMGTRAGASLKDYQGEITIGMATCGIAAGAEDVLEAIKDEIKKQNLKDIKIVKVGCIGFCHYEPIVQVNLPNRESIYYGNINPEKAREIVTKHIINKEYLEGYLINLPFEKA